MTEPVYDNSSLSFFFLNSCSNFSYFYHWIEIIEKYWVILELLYLKFILISLCLKLKEEVLQFWGEKIVDVQEVNVKTTKVVEMANL